MPMQAIPSSFRDPSGFVFRHEGRYYRAVHPSYMPHYRQLMDSGLYATLTGQQVLIPHTETAPGLPVPPGYLVLYPQQVPLVSYAWEWSFSMLKDAALTTLDIALSAIAHNMVLKDANTFNIQFVEGKPMLIDTLSFERYNEDEPWIAYRQFCEHFLAPLLLMRYTDAGLQSLLLAWPNGIPLRQCARLLPARARLNLHVNLHIFLQSNLSASPGSARPGRQRFSRSGMLNLLNGLRSFLQGLHPARKKTTWDDYYDETILQAGYLENKKTLVKAMLQGYSVDTLLDLGANDGAFSTLLPDQAKRIIALDQDVNCIDTLYTNCRKASMTKITPLVCDLMNPSPSMGWNNEERPALFQRVRADLVLALALMHHLAIAQNVPLEKILSLLQQLGTFVLLEFVDKSDPKVQQLLQNRTDIFPSYSLDMLRQHIAEYFTIIREEKIPGVDRTLFLLKRR